MEKRSLVSTAVSVHGWGKGSITDVRPGTVHPDNSVIVEIGEFGQCLLYLDREAATELLSKLQELLSPSGGTS